MNEVWFVTKKKKCTCTGIHINMVFISLWSFLFYTTTVHLNFVFRYRLLKQFPVLNFTLKKA
jgi:hypothetical protein